MKQSSSFPKENPPTSVVGSSQVEIVETLRNVVEIEAKTEEEAIRKVEEMYFNEDIVLGAENFDNDVVFNLLED